METYSSLSVEELVRKCAVSGDLAVWQEFVRRFHRLIAKVVLRGAVRFGDASKQTVDDLVQETYLKLCANNYRILREFDHRHPDAFIGFVQVLAANVVRDHFKSSYSKKRGANHVEGISDDLVPAAGESSSGSPKAIERGVLIQEVQRYLDVFVTGADQERDSRIFWLYYRVGLSAAAIAALPGIGLTTKGVESLILRITRGLRDQMTATAKPGELESANDAREGILPAESF
jgi:RNA polymerase sigma-70 factor (ECF subfamily)